MLRTTMLRMISRPSPILRPALFATPYSTSSGSNVQNTNQSAVQGNTNDNKTPAKEPSKLEHWEVLQLDPRGTTPCFANSHLIPEYASYNPPPGFTAEEIMQFQGAQDVFDSVDDVRKLLAWQKEHGSLERRVD